MLLLYTGSTSEFTELGTELRVGPARNLTVSSFDGDICDTSQGLSIVSSSRIAQIGSDLQLPRAHGVSRNTRIAAKGIVFGMSNQEPLVLSRMCCGA